jgi:hypothetical protein
MAVPAEKVLAAASGSTGGLGKIGTLAATSGVMYVCMAADKDARTAYWRVQTDNAHSLTWYRARSRVDSVTLTLDSVADTETFVLNGLTYTGEATANTATYDSREFSVAGDNAADAAALAALINADYSVVTAGTSVAGTDKLVITTDEGEHTITAAAAADYPNSQYALNATAATELASIVLAINHKHTVTAASVAAGDYFTIEIAGGIPYTFTAKAGAASAANRQFSKDTGNNETATSIAAVVNDATYGVPGITATANAAAVSFARDSQDDVITSLTSSSSTKLAVADAGGVPGVIAAATPGTASAAELSITPVWTKTLTVTEAGDQLTVTDIDCPGVYASATDAVVTLTPGTPAGTDGDLASVIYAVTGTAGAHVAVAQTATLLGLTKDYWNTGLTGVTATNTTAGSLYKQIDVEGWPYLYLGVTNTEGDTGTYVVGCTLI